MKNFKIYARTAFLAILILVAVFPSLKVSHADSLVNATAEIKPMEFYFHFVDFPVETAGLETKYIFNTTRHFRFLTLEEAYANSLYKPEGLPKINVNFYLYPNLAGTLLVNGSWQVFIWVNSSAYKPVEFGVSFKEITAGGNVLWDSGLLSPTVTSSIGSYIDVPVYCYNLTVFLSHSFSQGSTILVEVEVNPGSAADARIWYDSPLYPSKVILPVHNYAQPAEVKTYSADNSETTLFYYNWSENMRRVIVRANVTDPFGGYDIFKVNATIIDPVGNSVLKNVEMTRTSDGQWKTRYWHIYEVNWTYPQTAELGNYTIVVSVIDNNGYYKMVETGSFEPFVEERTCIFIIGIIEYYSPVFYVVDDVGDPLPNAHVYITWRNGTRDEHPRYTDQKGTITLNQLEKGTYGFTVLWKDEIVLETTVYVDSNGPYDLRTQVYQLTIKVIGNNGAPIQGAYVAVYDPSGIAYDLNVTDSLGDVSFKLPKGTYNIKAYFATSYCLSYIQTSASMDVILTETTTKNLVLTDYPPPIWTTLGFMMATLTITAIIIVCFIFFYLIRKKKRVG